ncbi:TfoX/Sxy family protein [Nocardia seriolae]|nr:TfoX/Sxy family protein [Nocardia seriolae]MTJ63056.1 RNA methyltransferase [Nocardia seriolae]MTJ73289.1 RNA methyltransferase [Nocardia seriolae]MTJ89137.1 RNA methyltransferase [Nocardia seriolae]MTK33115.1 RNA methyltransferase [Nocardia seriolae]MTK40949.1 RNA methyltransferase [Nocardia seriolae]
MAYDEKLADRIRDALGPEVVNVVEKKMFGGLAFLVGGNMAVAASGQGGLLARTDPATSGPLLRAGSVEPMEMRGKKMPGWLRVSAEAVADDEVLDEWVRRGVDYAKTLPPK